MRAEQLLLRAIYLTLLVLLASCANHDVRSPVASWRPSKNFDQRRPQLIIIHHTQISTLEKSLETLRKQNDDGRVSAHYLIGEDGTVLQLVAENQCAWHAGVSRWNGLDDVNSRSIGIELVNDGYGEFAQAQITSLISLLGDICTRQKISPQQIWAHADVAPTRKDDPNVHFPWSRLANAGFGLWPVVQSAQLPDGFDPWQALAIVGYDLRDEAAAVRAFHRHFSGTESTALTEQDNITLLSLQSQILGGTHPAPRIMEKP
jgi:N-acetylmuramoyl-L-alanine amidase